MTVSREREAGEEMRGGEQVWRSHLEFLKQTVTGEVRAVLLCLALRRVLTEKVCPPCDLPALAKSPQDPGGVSGQDTWAREGCPLRWRGGREEVLPCPPPHSQALHLLPQNEGEVAPLSCPECNCAHSDIHSWDEPHEGPSH